jgi:hypothetical protein
MCIGDHSSGTSRLAARLPVPVERIVARNAELFSPAAAFLSQLIAEREHLAPQRIRRRAPMAAALLSYRETAVRTPPRLPPGYRKSLVA